MGQLADTSDHGPMSSRAAGAVTVACDTCVLELAVPDSTSTRTALARFFNEHSTCLTRIDVTGAAPELRRLLLSGTRTVPCASGDGAPPSAACGD